MSNLKRRQAVIISGQKEKRDLAKTLEDPENNAYLVLELHTKHPISLSQMLAATRFTKLEIKQLYRQFKEASPTAIIHREMLRDIFSHTFKGGDAEHYSDLLFEAFDTDHSGAITFDKFICALSIICRGNSKERLEWLYKLYDPQSTGYISWHRLLYIITAISDLTSIESRVSGKRDASPSRHAEFVLNVGGCYLKENQMTTFTLQRFGADGQISKKQFFEVCTNDSIIREAIDSLAETLIPPMRLSR